LFLVVVLVAVLLLVLLNSILNQHLDFLQGIPEIAYYILQNGIIYLFNLSVKFDLNFIY